MQARVCADLGASGLVLCALWTHVHSNTGRVARDAETKETEIYN